MALFLSTYINKIDKKGRVSVPASFRAALVGESFQGIITFRSYKHPAIEGCGIGRMQRLSDNADSLDFFSDGQDDTASTIFADSQQLVFDSEGRVFLPQPLIEHAKLTDQVAFVGRGATFQIWNPEIFERMQAESRDRVRNAQASAKKSQGEHE